MKRTRTLSPSCSKPVSLSPLRTFSSPMRSRTARSRSSCSSPRWIEYLRPAIAGRESPGFAVDQLSELVAEIEPLRGDAGLSKCVAKSKLSQFAYCGRLQIDADAERRGIAHRLIDANRYSGLMQAERKAQPADAASGNDDFQLLHFAATRGSLTLLKVSNSTLRSSPSALLDLADVDVVHDFAGVAVDRHRAARAFPGHASHRGDQGLAVRRAGGLLQRFIDEVHAVIAGDRHEIRARPLLPC